jgi:hypothetical protein
VLLATAPNRPRTRESIHLWPFLLLRWRLGIDVDGFSRLRRRGDVGGIEDGEILVTIDRSIRRRVVVASEESEAGGGADLGRVGGTRARLRPRRSGSGLTA